MRAPVAACALALVTAACASAGLRLPDGPSRPMADADAARAFQQASASCRGVRTLTAEIGVSGRVGPHKLRGRVLAGFERPGSLRLEAPAPFGAPIFILTARGNRATLLLPRDRRVLIDAPVDDVIEALTGIRRSADDLLALVAGCLVDTPQPGSSGGARRYDSGWLGQPLAGGAEAFMREDGRQWRIFAGRSLSGLDAAATAGWAVTYDAFAAGFPGEVRITQGITPAAAGSTRADVTFRVSQLDANITIDPAAFRIDIPGGAIPMSLAELRQVGPLADQSGNTRNR